MDSTKEKYMLPLQGIPQGRFTREYSLGDAFLCCGSKDFAIEGGHVLVLLEGERVGDVFDLIFSLQGNIKTPCTRCGESFLLPIERKFHLVASLGEKDEGDDDEKIVVSRHTPILALDDLLYSFVVLSLPIRRTHPEGRCSKEVEQFFESQQESPRSGRRIFAKLLSGYTPQENDKKKQ